MQSFEDFLYSREKVVKKHISYFDDKGNVVEKEKAKKYIITEYDSEGNLINSIKGRCENIRGDKDR